MAKLPWYMSSKDKGATIEVHWLWILWQRVKLNLIRIFAK